MSTPRTWLDNMGCFSFVGLVATFVLLLGNGYAQSTASWPIYRSDSGLSGRAKVEGPIIPDLFWVKQIGLEKIQSPVVTADHTIIFTSRGDRFVYAINRDGSEKWRFSHKLPNGSFETFSHPPTLGSDGAIYVGSEEAGFFALNPDGSMKWRATVGGYVGTAPNIGKDGNIYLACDDTQIYVFSPSGARLAVASLDGLKPGNTPAIVSNSQIYVPAGNSIFVFSAGLARIARWQIPALVDVAWVVSNANGSVLYAGSSTLPLVLALDAQSGKQIWSYSYDARFGSPSQPALGPDGTIYFAGFDAGLLVALQPNGKEKWTHDQGSARYKTMPVVDASGDIYIVNEALGLVAFAPNKTQLWNLPNVQCKYAPAFGPDGTIYVPSLKKLYAVRHQPPFAVRLEFVGGDSQTACIDSVLANPIVARVFDQYGKSFEGQPVRFRVLGSLQDTSVPTDSLGEAKYIWRLDRLLGEQKLEISSLRNGQHLVGSPDTAIAFAVGPKIDGASEVVFDTTAVKEASEKTYTIFNRSDCILTLDSLVTKPPFFVISPIAKTTIAPNSSIVVRLQFAPTPNDSGSHVATLLIYSNDATDSLKQVTLRGEATTRPEIFVDPTSVPFGVVSVGKDSTKAITIYNLGTAQLEVFALDLSDSVHYKTDPKAPFSVSVADSRKVRITFTPTARQQYPAALKIVSNDSKNDTVEVTLSGSGKLAPDISVDPAKLVFGKVCIDSCETLALTIFNTGNAPLVVDSIKSTNPAFTIDSTEFIIPSGGSKKVQIGFCPREVKVYDGTLRIYSNDPTPNPFTVPMEGEGIAPKIVLRPEPPSFEVCANEIVNGVLNIVNDSDCDLRIDSISFAIVPTGLFALQTDNWQTTVAALVIPPRQSLPFAYSFQAPSKNFEVRFRVRSSGVPDPATVVIPGKIKPPAIAVVDTVNYGDIPVGGSKTLDAKTWTQQCRVTISGDTITGLEAFAFRREPFTFPVTLNEGEIANIPVSFHPKDRGVHTAFLEVFSDALPNPVKIVLIGNGILIAPDIDGKKEAPFAPVSVEVCDGASTNADTLVYWIKNAGNGDLIITGLETNEPFAVLGPSTPQTIKANDSLRVTLAFTPQSTGSFIGRLRITSNDSDENPFDVTLRGEGVAQPAIVVTPRAIDFGEVCADSLMKPVKIYNRGSAALRVTSLAFTNTAFSTTHANDFTIASCDSETVWVRFDATAGETDDGSLVINSNDPNEAAVNVALKGKGGAPNVAAAPEISFHDVEVQICAGKNNADTTTYVLRNSGTCDLIITALRTRLPFAVISPSLPRTVPAGGSLTVLLTFTPQTSGSFEDTLLVESNAPRFHPLLRGKGLSQPDIAVDPIVIDFGSVPIGATKREPLNVRNEGEQQLVVVEMSFTNPVFATETREFALKCGKDSTLSISFTPKAALAYDDTLWIVNNDPDENPALVILKGNGAAPPPQDIVVSPREIDFGKLCADSLAKVFVSNAGQSPLRVLNLAFNNAAFSTNHARSFTVLPGATDTITVRFDPKFAQVDTGSLCIESDDPDEAIVCVKLKGEGGAPDIEGKATASFRDVKVETCSGMDNKESALYELQNAGSCTLAVSSFRVNPPFSVADPKTPFKISPQGSSTLVLIFKPGTSGTFRDTLFVFSDDPDEPVFKIALNGIGVFAPAIEVTPSALSFDPVKVGSSIKLPLKVRNLGAALLTVDNLAVSQPDVFGIDVKEFSLVCNDDSVFSVAFSPKQNIAYKDTLRIWHNDADKENPLLVPLSGNGMAGFLATCESITFEESCVGASVEKSCTVANQGLADFNILAAFLASERRRAGENDFALAPSAILGNLPVNAAKEIKIIFTAASTIPARDTLVILTDLPAPNHERRIPLAGAAREKGAHIGLDRVLVNFVGNLDTPTLPEWVKITNNGCEPLTIANLQLLDKRHFEIKSDLSGKVLLPDSSVWAAVVFNGDLFDTTFTDTLLVFSNDSDVYDRPKRVQLSGEVENGRDICVTVTPEPVEFGEVAVGNEKNMPIVLKNCTPGTRLLVKPLEVLKDKEAFGIPALGETELFPNQSLTMNIVFKPNANRVFLATLLVEVWVKDSLVTKITKEIQLSGTGTGVDEVTLRPNVVTPNGDDKNDEAVFALPKDLKDVTLHIFDLRGLRVIVLDDRDNSKTIEWNGRDENKQIVLPGPYLWLIQAQGKKVKSGQIVVIR